MRHLHLDSRSLGHRSMHPPTGLRLRIVGGIPVFISEGWINTNSVS